MSLVFIILGIVTAGSALAAMAMRNLVHCVLALVVTFLGLAALYLQLDAQFAGFAQILVYVGAVAILMVFAILLTRGREPAGQGWFSSSWIAGGAVALAVFGLLTGVILSSKALLRPSSPAPEVPVRVLGEQLMTRFILPLEVLGLLLTAALIGAVVLAWQERSEGE